MSPDAGEFLLCFFIFIFFLTHDRQNGHFLDAVSRDSIALKALILCSFSLFRCSSSANAILERRPSILTPSGARSAVQRVKGEDLMLECIAEG